MWTNSRSKGTHGTSEYHPAAGMVPPREIACMGLARTPLKMGCMLFSIAKIRGTRREAALARLTGSRAGDGSLVVLSPRGCDPEARHLFCGSAGSGGTQRRARRWSAPVLAGQRR